MQHRITTDHALAVIATISIIAALTVSKPNRSLRHREDSVFTRTIQSSFVDNDHSAEQDHSYGPLFQFRNPMPKEDREALNAQANRDQKIVQEARLLLKQRRFAEAISLGKTALELVDGKPTNMNAVEFLGDVYLEQKRYEDALEAYYQVREHTRKVELDLSMALAYVRLGDLKKAREFYTEEKFFGDRLGDSYNESQKAEYFSQLPGTKDAKSFEASLLYARGFEHDSNGNDEEAAYYYRKVLEMFPTNGLYAYHLAKQLMRLKRYDEALPMWARAARFGKGENAKDALNRMGGFPAAQREQAIRDAAKIK